MGALTKPELYAGGKSGWDLFQSDSAQSNTQRAAASYVEIMKNHKRRQEEHARNEAVRAAYEHARARASRQEEAAGRQQAQHGRQEQAAMFVLTQS
jgi:hypothetical protein